MPSSQCVVCALAQKPRKIGEALLREGVGVREVADFINWWLAKEHMGEDPQPKLITKSSVDRHKNGTGGSVGHFVLKPAEQDLDMSNVEFSNVSSIAREMVRRYGALLQDPTYMPSSREAQDWAALEAKVDDLEQRRRDNNELAALMAGAAFKREALGAGTVIDVTPKELP